MSLFKEQLRKHLEESGMSAAELSRKTNIPRQCISDWLGGTRPRDIALIKRIATVLRVPVLNLLYGIGGSDAGAASTEVDLAVGESNSKSGTSLSALQEGLAFFCRETRELLQIRKMPHGRPILLSDAWEEILGWSLKELQESLWQEFIHPDDWPHTIETVEKSTSPQSCGETCRHRFLHKNKSWLYFETSLQLKLDRGILLAISRLIDPDKV